MDLCVTVDSYLQTHQREEGGGWSWGHVIICWSQWHNRGIGTQTSEHLDVDRVSFLMYWGYHTLTSIQQVNLIEL